MKKTPYKLIITGLACTALLSFIGCSDMLSKLDNIHWGATYTVRHLLQDLNRDGTDVAEGRYTEDLYERETLVNTVPNTPSEAKAKEIPGFTAQPFKQVIVNGDGSTTVDIYYDRNPVTLTFDPNGGYFVDSTTLEKSKNSIGITRAYGTTVSFRNPKFEGSNMSIEFYNWVPVDTATTLKTTGGTEFISFPIPSTSGTYRALWDFSTSVEKLSDALRTMPASGGKLTLTGDADQENFKKIGESIVALAGTPNKQIELDLRQLKIAKDAEITIQLNNDILSRDNKALTRVELPNSGIITLGENAFKRCSNLEYISIGKNVQIADTNPFWGCYKIEFHVDSDHPTLVASEDKKILLKKPQTSGEGYTLVSYPSATGTVDLGKLGYTITTIGKQALGYIPEGKTTIIIPESVESIGYMAIVEENAEHDFTIIMEGTTPPSLPDEGENKYEATLYSETCIHVPDDSVDDYKAAPGWSNYADDIHPMSAYPNKH